MRLSLTTRAANRAIVACALTCAAQVCSAAVEHGGRHGGEIAMVAGGALAFAAWKVWRAR